MINIKRNGVINLNNIFNLQKVDYIETSGPAYIDTGFIPNENTKIDIEFQMNSTADNGTFVYGAGGSAYNNNAFELYPWSNQWNINRGSSLVGHGGTASTSKLRLVVDKRNFTMYNTSGQAVFNGTFESENVRPSLSLYLGALHRTTGITPSNNGCKYYRCKLWDNGVLVRDLIPVIFNNDGALLDLIGGKIYQSISSTNMTYHLKIDTNTSIGKDYIYANDIYEY